MCVDRCTVVDVYSRYIHRAGGVSRPAAALGPERKRRPAAAGVAESGERRAESGEQRRRRLVASSCPSGASRGVPGQGGGKPTNRRPCGSLSLSLSQAVATSHDSRAVGWTSADRRISRWHSSSSVRPSVRPSKRCSGCPAHRANERTNERTDERTNGRTSERTDGASAPGGAARTGGRRPL